MKPWREAQYNLVGEPINPTQDESAIVHTEHPPSQRGTLLYEIGHALGVRGFMFVILVVAGILFAVWLSQPDSPTKTSTTPLDKSQQLDSYIPPLQKSFTSMIESFIPSYNAADTEIRKTNVRFQRKDAIVRYFSGSGSLRFQGWLGEVQGLRTESDGKASLSVKLKGSETVIGTWNNSLSDSFSDTMISRADNLYPSLMEIRNGDEVTVSGTFIIEGSGQDYVREMSLTEAGSMTSPEFVVRFSQINKGSTRTSLPVPAQWANVIVLGFKAGESSEETGKHAGDLGMTKLRDCKERKGGGWTAPEYVDCEFLGNNGESIEASFYFGQLQRIEYNFPLDHYDAILEKIEKSFGNPRIRTDQDDPSVVVGAGWGGKKFDISLVKTADGASGGASIVFDPSR